MDVTVIVMVTAMEGQSAITLTAQLNPDFTRPSQKQPNLPFLPSLQKLLRRRDSK